MNVKKVRPLSPETPTYEVTGDPEDPHGNFLVCVIKGRVECASHGLKCAHVKAVQEKRAEVLSRASTR